MMDIELLKSQIESGTLQDTPIIFLNSENTFIARQYTHKIAELHNLSIQVVEDLTEVASGEDSIFGEAPDYLYVYFTDELKTLPINISVSKNLIISADKIDKKLESSIENYIVAVPKIKEWQVKDYAYSNCSGVDTDDLDRLIALCGNDIYRVDREISKLNVFGVAERQSLFREFIKDNIFDDVCQYTVFSLTNALLSRNLTEAAKILEDISRIEISPMGLVAILYNNLKNIINIQLSKPGTTAEDLDMNPKQFFAIKKNSVGVFTNSQLIKAFDVVTSVDDKLKSGAMPQSTIVDYLIINLLN